MYKDYAVVGRDRAQSPHHKMAKSCHGRCKHYKSLLQPFFQPHSHPPPWSPSFIDVARPPTTASMCEGWTLTSACSLCASEKTLAGPVVSKLRTSTHPHPGTDGTRPSKYPCYSFFCPEDPDHPCRKHRCTCPPAAIIDHRRGYICSYCLKAIRRVEEDRDRTQRDPQSSSDY